MRKKTTTGRTEKISGRISARARTGAELLGNCYGVSLSTVLEKGIETLMAREGLIESEFGTIGVVDRAAAMTPGARVRWISENHPKFMSEQDKVWMTAILILEEQIGRVLSPDELEQYYESHHDGSA